MFLYSFSRVSEWIIQSLARYFCPQLAPALRIRLPSILRTAGCLMNRFYSQTVSPNSISILFWQYNVPIGVLPYYWPVFPEFMPWSLWWNLRNTLVPMNKQKGHLGLLGSRVRKASLRLPTEGILHLLWIYFCFLQFEWAMFADTVPLICELCSLLGASAPWALLLLLKNMAMWCSAPSPNLSDPLLSTPLEGLRLSHSYPSPSKLQCLPFERYSNKISHNRSKNL